MKYVFLSLFVWVVAGMSVAALEMRTLVRQVRVPAPVIASGVCLIIILVVGYAKMAGYWNGWVPELRSSS